MKYYFISRTIFYLIVNSVLRILRIFDIERNFKKVSTKHYSACDGRRIDLMRTETTGTARCSLQRW